MQEASENKCVFKLTRSRIEKGLIAIPGKYRAMFPTSDTLVYVTVLPNSGKSSEKKFTPKTSSANEARIYGMREWFDEHKAIAGDSIVIERVESDVPLYLITIIRQSVA